MMQRILKALRGAVAPVAHPNQNSWMRFLLPNTTIDFSKHVGDGLSSNVFMSPILWIWRASLEARVGVLTETKEDTQLDKAHDLAKLLANPNPHTSGAAMLLATWASWFLDGNVYFLKARDGSGAVRQLWYVPHWMMEPKTKEGDSTSFVDHYLYKPEGTKEYPLEVTEVVHLKCGVDPRNVRKGFAHLKGLLREVFNDDEAANFVSALLLNGGVPGVIISPKDATTANPDDVKATKDYIQVQFGRSKRGAPLALGAPTEVKEFGYDPQKMDLSAVRDVSEERVCAHLALPAAVVGFGSGMQQTKVGASLVELHRIAWLGCIIPNQDLLAEEWTRNLKDDFALDENQRVAYDRLNVVALQEDRNKESERLGKLVQDGIMKRGEARKALRLKVEKSDDVYLLPLGVTETGPGAPEPEPQPQAPAPGTPEETGKKAAKRRPTKAQLQLLRAMDKLKVKAAKQLEARLGEFFGRYGKAASTAYLATAAKASDDELRVELMFGSMGTPKFRTELRGIFASHYVAVHRESQKLLGGMGIGLSMPDAVELRLLALGGTQAGLVDMTTEARKKALRIIKDGREAQKGPNEIAKELEEAVPAGRFNDPRTRATLIARSETRNAQTMSAIETYSATPGIDHVMIIDGRLGDTDDDCEDINGTIADFDTARQAMMQEHPNGTRDVVPVFGGQE